MGPRIPVPYSILILELLYIRQSDNSIHPDRDTAVAFASLDIILSLAFVITIKDVENID